MTTTLDAVAPAETAPTARHEAIADAAQSPQFYDRTEPLNAEVHGSWRLLPGDMAFAQSANTVMLTASEFGAASRSYPILFAANDGTPIALLGLERRNGFVTDGRWADDVHVPAYVRRYPFIFYATAESDNFLLGIDGASPRIARDGDLGTALFDGTAASTATTEALHFCEMFRRESEITRVFTDALAEHDLLVEQRAAVTLPDGVGFDIAGFKVVDRERLDAMDDATIAAWHRRGWLGAIQCHLLSLARFQAMLAPSRQAA